jgi:hypothetical protein
MKKTDQDTQYAVTRPQTAFIKHMQIVKIKDLTLSSLLPAYAHESHSRSQ